VKCTITSTFNIGGKILEPKNSQTSNQHIVSGADGKKARNSKGSKRILGLFWGHFGKLYFKDSAIMGL